MLVNIYTYNIGAPEYIKKILENFKKMIDSNAVIVDFNTPLSTMDRSSRQKINKDTAAINDTSESMDLIDIHRAFHSIEAEYTFLNAHETFSKIDHMVRHKISLNKFKKTEVISSIFSDHNGLNL